MAVIDVSNFMKKDTQDKIDEIKHNSNMILDFYTKIEDVNKDFNHSELVKTLLGTFEAIQRNRCDDTIFERYENSDFIISRYLELDKMQIMRKFDKSGFMGLQVTVPLIVTKTHKYELDYLVSEQDQVTISFKFIPEFKTFTREEIIFQSQECATTEGYSYVENPSEIAKDYGEIRDEFFLSQVSSVKTVTLQDVS